MQEIWLSLFQSLQLVALTPCLFIVVFLLLTVRRPATITVPCLYFLSLSASFLQPLVPAFGSVDAKNLHGALLFVESLTPALSFLLILQFIHRHPPKAVFWLVLAIPVIGGSSFIYGVLNFDEVCLRQSYCLPANSLKALYQIASSGLIFMLLTVYYSRQGEALTLGKEQIRHRYWLIVAMIALSLSLMTVDLATITERVTVEESLQIATVIRLGFIYLVLTSLFRVFDGTVDVDAQRLLDLAPSRRKPGDSWIIEKIERAMSREFAYRDCPTLPALSEKLAIPEHQLSRVINTHYGMSFSDFVNAQRIEEAKARLMEEDTPVTSIALEVGFGSIATFNRVFKEKTAMTPTAYRKNHTPPEKLKATP